MTSLDFRKRLTLALISAERLHLVFERTTYFDPVVPRAYLDALWFTVLNGVWPSKLAAQNARRFATSSVVPDEEGCSGIDFYGLSFVSCLDILTDPAQREDRVSLAYISEEIEINLLDHYLHELYTTGHALQDPSLEAKIASDARMQRHQSRIATDEATVAAMKMDSSSVESLKKLAIFDILS